jgi:hypothetical protein
MIDFVCDGCHTQLQIGDGLAGKLGRCPTCGTNTRVPGHPRRTPKWKMIFLMAIIPFLVVAFWGLMFCIADPGLAFSFVLGGVIAVLLGIGFCWAVTNIGTFLSHPRYYRLWKKGGGGPFSIPWPRRSTTTLLPDRLTKVFHARRKDTICFLST